MPTLRAVLPILLVGLLAGASGGCRRHSRAEGPWMMVTQTNIHVHDPARGLLSSNNYLEGTVIPVCTPIRIDLVTEREARLTDLQSGRALRYVFERHMREPVQQHLDRYFAPQCPAGLIDTLPELDRQGIQQGQALPGMTKQGVVFAIGYPPDHATASLHEDAWRYWLNRRGTIEVRFVNGAVSEVRR